MCPIWILPEEIIVVSGKYVCQLMRIETLFFLLKSILNWPAARPIWWPIELGIKRTYKTRFFGTVLVWFKKTRGEQKRWKHKVLFGKKHAGCPGVGPSLGTKNHLLYWNYLWSILKLFHYFSAWLNETLKCFETSDMSTKFK